MSQLHLNSPPYHPLLLIVYQKPVGQWDEAQKILKAMPSTINSFYMYICQHHSANITCKVLTKVNVILAFQLIHYAAHTACILIHYVAHTVSLPIRYVAHQYVIICIHTLASYAVIVAFWTATVT